MIWYQYVALLLFFITSVICVIGNKDFCRDNNRRPTAQPEVRMRPLNEEEMRAVFSKIRKYVGENIRKLVDRDDGEFLFRLHHNKVFYARDDVIRSSQHFKNKNLICIGTCVGKFTKTGKFHLMITALPLLSRYAQHKVWLKAGAVQQFLYGNHITKSGLVRISESTPAMTGVVLHSLNDVPLGFGIITHSTADCRKVEPLVNVVLHQADIGTYIRNEALLL